jgi:UDP-glucose 4-epimerase
MKIAVLGGSGFLGSHLCDLLSLYGHDVNIFDIKKSKYKKKNQKIYIGSILDRKKLALAIKGCDFVYHFAALAELNVAITRPVETAKINIIGTINALVACKKHNVKRFIFASSIYANTEEGGFYGSSKQAAESYIERFHKTFGLNYTILRFGSLYGSRSGRGNGIKILINSGIKKGKLIYGGSKRAARKYIHVEDAANSCAEVIQKKYQNKYLTITGRHLVKIKNVMNMLAKYLNISNDKIRYLNHKNYGHYDTKPTTFVPRLGRPLKNKKEKNFKQSLKILTEECKLDLN